MLTLLFASCKNQERPRTVYWSASSFINPQDSLTDYSFYLAYYIEVSDTGDVKLMMHKTFQSPKQYFSILLSKSRKNRILDLAIKSMSQALKPNSHEYIYDGPIYNLKVKCDTIDKKISFITPLGNQMQRELILIMDSIWNHPRIKNKIYFDLTKYEEETKQEILKKNPLPLRLKSTIHFSGNYK